MGDVNQADRAWLWSATTGFVALPRSDASIARQSPYHVTADGRVIGVEWTEGFASSHLVVWHVSAPPLPDADGDGVDDVIGGGTPGSFNDVIDGQPATTGNIVSVPAGLVVRVTDAADPDGVRVVVSGTSSERVALSVCGFTVRLAAGSDVVLTCGSVEVKVSAGDAVVDLGDGTQVVGTAGSVFEVTSSATGGFTVANQTSASAGTVTITTDGLSAEVPSGATSPVEKWRFSGFAAPVANPPEVNRINAGRAVVLEWRLTDPQGRPVLDVAEVSLSFAAKDCGTGEVTSIAPQPSTGGSQLQNLGDGSYRITWKTARTARGCGELRVDMGQGVLRTAIFRFR